MKHDPLSEHENRTGLQIHADRLAEMIEGTEEFPPTPAGEGDAVAELRVEYARRGELMGSMPRGHNVAAELVPLLDRLGARLAYERVGVRLYDALISKHDAYGSFTGGPTRDELMALREAERDHVHLVRELILEQGGDPTAITPSANLQLVATRGLLDVVVDARTTLVQCLDAALLAELADLESWRQLAALAHEMPDATTLSARLERAAETEEAHLSRVRGWVAAAKGAKQ